MIIRLWNEICSYNTLNDNDDVRALRTRSSASEICIQSKPNNEDDHNEYDNALITELEECIQTDDESESLSDEENVINSNKSFKIQIQRLKSFDDDDQPWILTPKSNRNKPTIKRSNIIKNIDKYHKSKRMTLTNHHNFLWLTNALRSSLHSAETASEITKESFNRILNLLPIPIRDEAWQICNIDNETYLFYEDYTEFVDALLIATGQYDICDTLEDEIFEIRDMTQIFMQMVDIDNIFKAKMNAINASKYQQSTLCLSTKGAVELILKARKLKNTNDLTASDDLCIVLLTGFTRRALKHALTFCSRVFWKLLTDIWWDDEDVDEYRDDSLPMKKRRSKISEYQRKSIQNNKIDVLFPHLNLSDDDYDDEKEDDNKYLKVVE